MKLTSYKCENLERLFSEISSPWHPGSLNLEAYIFMLQRFAPDDLKNIPYEQFSQEYRRYKKHGDDPSFSFLHMQMAETNLWKFLQYGQQLRGGYE